jgi:hypothetical protein
MHIRLFVDRKGILREKALFERSMGVDLRFSGIPFQKQQQHTTETL